MLRHLVFLSTLLLSGCVAVEEPPASSSPSAQPKAMVYEPTQCRTNPWQSETDDYEERSDAEAKRIVEYYAGKGVTAKDVRFEEKYEATCAACSCPRGDWVRANIDASDTARAKDLGWKDPDATSSSPASGPNSTIAA